MARPTQDLSPIPGPGIELRGNEVHLALFQRHAIGALQTGERTTGKGSAQEFDVIGDSLGQHVGDGEIKPGSTVERELVKIVFTSAIEAVVHLKQEAALNRRLEVQQGTASDPGQFLSLR